MRHLKFVRLPDVVEDLPHANRLSGGWIRGRNGRGRIGVRRTGR
jgi:hypothetical protein